MAGWLPLSAHRAVLLVSCRVKNLKGSRINKRRAKLQQAFGSHAGSGTVHAHKELTVSTVALCIPAVYSPRHTRITFAQRRHTEKVALRLACIAATDSLRVDVNNHLISDLVSVDLFQAGNCTLALA